MRITGAVRRRSTSGEVTPSVCGSSKTAWPATTSIRWRSRLPAMASRRARTTSRSRYMKSGTVMSAFTE